jgi:hypothetical protein
VSNTELLVRALLDNPTCWATRCALLDCVIEEHGCSASLGKDLVATLLRIAHFAHDLPAPRFGFGVLRTLQRWRRVPNSVLCPSQGGE